MNTMREVTVPVVHNPTIFDYSQRGLDVNSVATLRPERLTRNECHVLFPDYFRKAALVVSALEEYSFHPGSELNKKFNYQRIQVNGASLNWISFPLEYREVCERIATRYELICLNDNDTQYFSYNLSKERVCTQIFLEAKRNVLLFAGSQHMTTSAFKNEWEAVVERTDALYTYGQME